MKQATSAIKSKKLGWYLAAKTFNVPATTLRRRVNKNSGARKRYLEGRIPTFNTLLETEIIQLIKERGVRFFGLTTTDDRSLAYELAERDGIRHTFSNEKKMAGWQWLQGFINRNPTISL